MDPAQPRLRSLGVLTRRRSEETLVLTAELRGAFIADGEPHCGCIRLVCDHATAGLVEPDMLLILKRADRGDGFKAVVKNGYAHTRECSDRLEIEALGVMIADPSHSLSDVHQARVGARNLTEQAAMRTHQQPKHEFVLQRLSHDRD